ncbi:MAG: hypothetical protein FWD75_03235 [Propionibacteriaceae bacterium]|nr:hypothetical protein [Propionibacteriaceae bacterium]
MSTMAATANPQHNKTHNTRQTLKGRTMGTTDDLMAELEELRSYRSLAELELEEYRNSISDSNHDIAKMREVIEFAYYALDGVFKRLVEWL